MIGSSTFLRADCVGVFFRLQMVNPDIDKRASKLFQSIQSLTLATEIKLRLILHWIHGYYINQDPFWNAAAQCLKIIKNIPLEFSR